MRFCRDIATRADTAQHTLAFAAPIGSAQDKVLKLLWVPDAIKELMNNHVRYRTTHRRRRSLNNFQKIGGITALIHSAAYLVGIGLYLTILSPILDAAPDQYLALLQDYQALMYAWILIAYWVSGFCLIVVALAFYDQLKASCPLGAQTATVLGLIWAGLIIASANLMLHDFGGVADLYSKNPAQAEIVWVALMAVENGIVSGNELIGGLWILMISWIALRHGRLRRALNYVGLIIGLAGIVSIIPPLTEVAATFFGLSMIVWFAWVGIVMLRGIREQP